MPTPQGRDRLEATPDGGLVLLTRVRRPWGAREGPEGRGQPRPGTAVRWEDELFEVVEAESRPQGGFRYLLRPWDERQLVRSVVDYPGAPSGAEATSAPEPAPAPSTARAASEAASRLPSGARELLARIPSGWRYVLSGALPALLLGWFFPFRVLGEGMSFLAHELGHTLVSWLFGRFAVPAVILTLTFEQSRLLAALVWAGILFLAWRLRDARRLRVLAWAAAAVYPVFAFTPLHVQAINLGGHAAEVAVAALFLARARRGGFFADGERPVYAFLGTYLWMRNARLFFGVAFDAAARQEYRTVAITSENDLVKVASAAGADLAAVAFLTFLVCAVVPLLPLVLGRRGRPGSDGPLSS